MEFFGVSLFSGLSGGGLIAVAALFFIVGLVFIIKGGDWFVDSASWFAEITGIPKFVVGATVVSFATTLPEMLVSIRAAANGSTQMAIGNAIGSVTANTTLIMGVSLVAMAGAVNRKSFSVKGILFIASSAAILLLSLSGALPVWSAAILWTFFLIFMFYNIFEGKKEAALDGPAKFEKGVLGRNIIFFILGTAGIVFGAEFLVGSGQTLARSVGISEGIIGFTVIALGTSLPELVTTLTAIRKKEASLSVGNIVGANVIDLTLILPLCAVIGGKPLPVANINLVFDFPVCLAAAAVVVIPTIIKGKFKKWQGFALLAIYVAYLVCLVLNETHAITLG
ncbi:MAG: calcium/sodium antiporter [Faecalibacterium sp.]|nr:calcium/sodium antiporter [Ruminococcus sp.]MCM1392607.1 calcium/sodium antiporter [Ruminococcus sp.]MCM1486528.1 calcium/sodium antiporter [Faecalibacterium sp.]